MDENENTRKKFRLTQRVELNFWKTCGLNALGLLIASATTPSINFGNAFYFFALVVLIWFMNWIVRPVLVVFALPFIIFTMGIGMLFINALIIYVSASIIKDGIEVNSYWAALWASFLVSVLSWSLEMFRSERIMVFKNSVIHKKTSKDDDVIDV
jgi:putative membrane protein